MPINFDKLSDEQLKIAAMVAAEAEAQGVNPDHVLPLAFQESKFNAKALGPMTRRKERAIGVMQLLPSTAKDLGVNPNILEENIRGGVAYWKKIFEDPKVGNGQDIDRAYIAYNAGPNSQYFKTGNPEDIPTESIMYLQKIRSYAAEDETAETEAMTSEAAPPESLNQNEEFVSSISGADQVVAEGEGGAPKPDQFDFDFEEFKKQQALEAQNKPYGFSDQSTLAGLAGGATGLTLGTGQVGLKYANDIRNLPSNIAAAAQAANASTDAVKNWEKTQGYKSRGAKTYAQSHRFEEGTRPGAKLRNPLTGEKYEPKFRFSKPPVIEDVSVKPPPQSPLQKASGFASKILTNPIVNRTLGGAGTAFGATEAGERFKQGDPLGGTLAATSALGSAASLYPPLAVPGTTVSAVATGGLTLADQIRNKLAAEAKNPPPPVSDAELQQLAKQPVGGFYPQRMGKRRQPDEVKALRAKLLGDLDNQLQTFSKPTQSPLQQAK